MQTIDSVTHIVLGACIGEAVAGKSLGKKALLYGGLAQSLPDIDAVNSFWMDTADDLVAHRGITHSLLFIILTAALTGMLMKRLHRSTGMSTGRWVAFVGIELITHIFLDALNNYGTGWFEPFSDYRVSFNTLFVADPLFTIWPLVGFTMLLFLKADHKKRKWWSRSAIVLSSVYLLYCIYNKLTIDSEVRSELRRQQLSVSRYFTTPTALNNWLWYIVAEDKEGYHIGYRSVFDQDETINFRLFSRNDHLLKQVKDEHDLKQLIKFSQGYYTVERWGRSLVFNDLRFGQITGWHDPEGKFVFHYFLKQPGANEMVVQRGRFSGWNNETLHSLVERIKGKR